MDQEASTSLKRAGDVGWAGEGRGVRMNLQAPAHWHLCGALLDPSHWSFPGYDDGFVNKSVDVVTCCEWLTVACLLVLDVKGSCCLTVGQEMDMTVN